MFVIVNKKTLLTDRIAAIAANGRGDI